MTPRTIEPRSQDAVLPSPLQPQDMASCVRDVVRFELRSFQAKLHAELKEIRSMVGRAGASATRRVGVTISGHSETTLPDTNLSASHAWVNRSMRSYAVASELNDMEVTSSVGSKSPVPEMLPNVITKGTGPLAKARLRRTVGFGVESVSQASAAVNVCDSGSSYPVRP